MAKVDFRPAYEIQAGDEVSLNLAPDQYSEWKGAVVIERRTDPDGRVILVLSADPGYRIRTKPREE